MQRAFWFQLAQSINGMSFQLPGGRLILATAATTQATMICGKDWKLQRLPVFPSSPVIVFQSCRVEKCTVDPCKTPLFLIIDRPLRKLVNRDFSKRRIFFRFCCTHRFWMFIVCKSLFFIASFVDFNVSVVTFFIFWWLIQHDIENRFSMTTSYNLGRPFFGTHHCFQ